MAAGGYTALTASELEYYLFRATYRQAHAQHYLRPRAGGWYLEDYHVLQGTRESRSRRRCAGT
jgi:glutamine synthetase